MSENTVPESLPETDEKDKVVLTVDMGDDTVDLDTKAFDELGEEIDKVLHHYTEEQSKLALEGDLTGNPYLGADVSTILSAHLSATNMSPSLFSRYCTYTDDEGRTKTMGAGRIKKVLQGRATFTATEESVITEAIGRLNSMKEEKHDPLAQAAKRVKMLNKSHKRK